MPDPRQPSLGQLISSTIDSAKRLGQAQVALIQAEIKADGQAIVGVGILGLVAVGSISLATIFLLVTIAYVIVQLGLPVWAGFGIVTLLLIITAGVAGFLAYVKSQKIKGPELAMQELQKTQEALGATPDAPQA